MSVCSSSLVSPFDPKSKGVPNEIIISDPAVKFPSAIVESPIADMERTSTSPSGENADQNRPPSSLAVANPHPAKSQGRSARAMKPLPESLKEFLIKDMDKVHCEIVLVKMDPNSSPTEVNLAQYIDIGFQRIDLNAKKDLVADQIRKLCRNVGCKGTHSASHGKCQKALATLKTYQNVLREKGVHAGIIEARALNSLLKAINVVFGSDFFDRFLNLNGPRDRRDHKTDNMPSDFWKDAADHYNLSDFDADDDDKYTLVVPNIANPAFDDLQELLRDPQIDLHNADPISDKVLKVSDVFVLIQTTYMIM